jgi:hypothetical protein
VFQVKIAGGSGISKNKRFALAISPNGWALEKLPSLFILQNYFHSRHEGFSGNLQSRRTPCGLLNLTPLPIKSKSGSTVLNAGKTRKSFRKMRSRTKLHEAKRQASEFNPELFGGERSLRSIAYKAFEPISVR